MTVLNRIASFARVKVYMPHSPETLRWIDVVGRVVYENTCACPTANVIRLI